MHSHHHSPIYVFGICLISALSSYIWNMLNAACKDEHDALQAVIGLLEFLTLRGLFEVYEGNRAYQEKRVADDFNNVRPLTDVSDIYTRLSEVPQKGIEALVSLFNPMPTGR